MYYSCSISRKHDTSAHVMSVHATLLELLDKHHFFFGKVPSYLRSPPKLVHSLQIVTYRAANDSLINVYLYGRYKSSMRVLHAYDALKGLTTSTNIFFR